MQKVQSAAAHYILCECVTLYRTNAHDVTIDCNASGIILVLRLSRTSTSSQAFALYEHHMVFYILAVSLLAATTRAVLCR